MPSHKRLSSVCHSIAQHAASSSSYVHPHLGKAAEKAGRATVQVDLLDSQATSKWLEPTKELILSLSALRGRFAAILSSERFDASAISSALLMFEFRGNFDDYYPKRVNSFIKAASGKTYVHAVNLMGNGVSPNAEWWAQCAGQR